MMPRGPSRWPYASCVPGSQYGWRSCLLQPRDDVFGVLVRWEDRVEDLLDAAVADDQRDALEQGHVLDLEGGQVESAGEGQLFVAQQLEGQVQPLGGFALVGGVLSAQPVDRGAEVLQLAVVIAESAGLRGAAAGAGDLVPAPRQVAVRLPRARVAVDDGPAG